MTAPSAPSSLGHYPSGERWAFDESVTHVFDDMLARSIPDYQTMRGLVADLALAYAEPGTDVVDLGCSRGEALIPLMAKLGAANRYVGVETSAPMLAAARERFASWPERVVSIRELDLRTSYPVVDASVTLCVLTLMFVPINHRARILRDAYRATRPGGALILVEKLLGSDAEVDRVMVERYHAMKAAHGYSREEIERKRLALEGVQVPVTADWNEQMLRAAGFASVECFWRWMSFAGFLAVRSR